MIAIQTTARLIRKLPLDASGYLTASTIVPVPASPVSTGHCALDGWRAEWLDECQAVLMIHEPTLLPLILPGRQRQDLPALEWLFQTGLLDILSEMGCQGVQFRQISDGFQPLAFIRERWPRNSLMWGRLLLTAERQIRCQQVTLQSSRFCLHHSLAMMEVMMQTGVLMMHPVQEFLRWLEEDSACLAAEPAAVYR